MRSARIAQAEAMTDDVSPQRPLPECLTRFLSEPAPRPPAPQPRRGIPETPVRDRASSSSRALQIVLLWALGYNLFGFAIILLLWRSMQ